jgi:hypothetical protein
MHNAAVTEICWKQVKLYMFLITFILAPRLAQIVLHDLSVLLMLGEGFERYSSVISIRASSFNTKHFYVLHARGCLCVLYGSLNKQHLILH